MNEFTLTSVAISVVGLGWLWLSAYASVRRDVYRCDIRAMRDGLFDFMWQNDLPFDNAAYRGVREELNGLLRMSNTTSALQFVCLISSHIRWGDFRATDHLSHLADGPLKRELERVRHLAIRRLLRFLFYGQTLMNVLWDVWSEKYNEIKDSDINCFYSNHTVNMVLNKLEKEWKYNE